MKCKFTVLIALVIKDNIKEHKEFSVLPEHRINQSSYADYYEWGHALLPWMNPHVSTTANYLP